MPSFNLYTDDEVADDLPGRRSTADDDIFEKFRTRGTAPQRRVVVEGKSGRRTVQADIPKPTDLEPGDGPFNPDLRYSSYDGAAHGPKPIPNWVITSFSAIDTPLGIVKTGKEADVTLLDRSLPGVASSLMAVKTYRSADHRLFHRDSSYQEGRRVRRSRETRAMATRTAFGRELLAGKWAFAEFEALSRLWQAGANVPYPVQLIGSELMMEFVGSPDGTAAPRLAGATPDGDPVEYFRALWADLVSTLDLLADLGFTHGDLSPYNILVCDGRCVLIDLPQVVDIVGNPLGLEFLARDCATVAAFFVRRGVGEADAEELARRLADRAGVPRGRNLP
jgi:RIO kinase 1